MNVWKVAWRNVWRNARRSAITISAIAFGLVITTLYSGMMVGYLADMERSVVEYEMGDAQIFPVGYRKKPSLYTAIPDAEKLVATLEQAGFRASCRYLGGGLGAAGEYSAGIRLIGVDPARDRTVSRLGDQVEQGAWLDDGKPREVVLGRRLARTLGVKPGGEIVVLTQAADGSSANELFTVRGILKGIADGTDRAGVFLTAGAFRTLLAHEGGAHQILVRKPDAMTLDAATARIAELAPGLEVQSWRQLVPTLATMMQASQGAVATTSFIIFVAIGIVLLNAMLMTVFERVREFGVLKAIGMGPGMVVALVVLESLMQAGVAAAIGLCVALPGSLYLGRVGIDVAKLADVSMAGVTRSPIWRGEYSTATFTGPLVMLFFIVLLAVLYPAIKAARLRPIEAMRQR